MARVRDMVRVRVRVRISTFFSVHQQNSELKTKSTLIKVSQKKHGLMLLALVSKFKNDA